MTTCGGSVDAFICDVVEASRLEGYDNSTRASSHLSRVVEASRLEGYDNFLA